MDLVHERASIVAEEEEDRISNLPDDIIHRILSFLDMKYVVQNSAVSRKWKHIWTSMPYLNLDSGLFPKLAHFAKFVKQTLSHRNYHTNVSAVDLKFTGHHDSREKNINLFSKCVNLKDLTLHKCSMYHMKIFNVCCPQLSNLTMKDVTAFLEVLEVVAPKLENLTASISTRGGCYSVDFLQLSIEGPISLQKLNLSKSNENYWKTRNFPRLLDLLYKLSSAKFLILDMDIIQCLEVLGLNPGEKINPPLATEVHLPQLWAIQKDSRP
ncbi:F-box domain, cyclin-like protein [Tanacetum coccineum]